MMPTRKLRDVKMRAVPLNNQTKNNNDQNIVPQKKGGKRKAESSPPGQDKVKRSALGNLTNAVVNVGKEPTKAIGNTAIKRENGNVMAPPPLKKLALANSNAINTRQNLPALKKENIKILQPPKEENAKIIGKPEVAPRPTKVITRAAARAVQSKPANANETIIKKEKEVLSVGPRPTRRISNDFDSKTDDETLYMTALSSSSSSMRLSIESGRSSDASSEFVPSYSDAVDRIENQFSVVPAGIVDFDKENWDDPFQVSNYAMDIFNYLKSREQQFKITNYITDQVHISKWMRSLLVDWMVEVQETFELNHETLYLAVKIVDLYLGKVVVIKDKLQLLGAAALFMACKYDVSLNLYLLVFFLIISGFIFYRNERHH